MLPAREEPRRAREELELGVEHRVVRVRVLDEPAALVVPLVPPPFFIPRNSKPASSAASSTSSRNLWIALWLSAVTPTRRPARMSAIAMRAPFHVFPEPGGPCTKR